MIKLLLILMSFVIFCNVPQCTYCDEGFARITKNHTYLYKTPKNDNDVKNIICIMENTYYVKILLTYDEDFYKVEYNGVSGYVLRKQIKKVNEKPENPFPENVSMLTINNNTYLRSTPERSNNNLLIIPANCSKLKYIGKAYGEQLDDFRDNLWYYVEYENICGYVYCEYIESISNIYPNTEKLTFVNNNDFDDIINPLSDETCTIIIVCLSLPILLIIFLLYKKPKARKEKFKEKIIIKEYDEKL